MFSKYQQNQSGKFYRYPAYKEVVGRTPSPTLTPEQQARINAQRERSEAERKARETVSLVYSPITAKELAEAESTFHTSFANLSDHSLEPVSCLEGKNKAQFDLVGDIAGRADDSRLAKIISDIRIHKFSSSGTKSTHEVNFYQICKLNNTYYLFFTSMGTDKRPLNHFAYTDGLNNTLILEKLDEIATSISPEYVRPQGYWGCGSTYVANNLEVFASCGAGDGGWSQGEIFRIDTTNGKMVEKLACSYHVTEGVKCQEENGKIYYQSKE